MEAQWRNHLECFLLLTESPGWLGIETLSSLYRSRPFLVSLLGYM